jgi:D-3-phosphoglycerate dehydrogenase
MKTVIVTTSPGFGTVGKAPGFIADKGWELIRCVDTGRPAGGVPDHIERMEFLVVGLAPATAELIAKAPKLKAILKHGVGVDNIDIPAATARKIPVLNTPAANANAVAELALGGMFSFARRIPMVHRAMVEGGWQRYVGTEIEEKTLGIVGLGNIGKILARKAKALGMRVLASDIYPDKAFTAEYGVEEVGLETLLAQADYVSLHVFGGKDNTHLIGAKELAVMKSTACIMNFARGEILDLDALAAALEKNTPAGAVIDAYTHEPPDRSHPVFKSPNVVFTPHSGADTKESVGRMSFMNVTDIAALLAGEKPARVLNPEVFM